MAKKGLFGLIAGIGLGAGLGVLFAPEKGEVTRKKLKEKLDDLVKEVKELDAEDVKLVIEEKIDEIKEDLEDLDKEKVKEVAQEKLKQISDKIEDLAKLAKDKATPVVMERVDDLRKYALKVTKQVEKKLEK
jgi:gas vesicle protein